MKQYPLLKKWKIRQRKEYLFIQKAGSVYRGKYLTLLAHKTAKPLLKMGMTVGKRYGKAHERNAFKRKMRELFRLQRHVLPTGVQFVVLPKQSAKMASLHSLQSDLFSLLTKGPCP